MRKIISLLLIVVLSLSFIAKLDVETVYAEETSAEVIELKQDEKATVEVDEPGETFTFSFTPEETARFEISFLSCVVKCSYYDSVLDRVRNHTNLTGMQREITEGEAFTFTVGLSDETATGTIKVIVTYPGTTVIDIDSTEITAGVEKELSFTKTYDVNYCEFVPEESGWYQYYSSGNHDIQGFIYDSELNCLLASDNRQYYMGQYPIWGDFEEAFYFEAGKKYYLGSMSTYSSEGTYKVCIEKLSKATDMSFGTQEEINKYIGEESNLKLYYTPEDCEPEKITWVSDNTDVLEIDENGDCHYKALGSAMVTATNESGLTASVKVNVINYPEIKLNEELKGWTGFFADATYTFTPEVSGKYAYSVKLDGWHPQPSVRLTIYDKHFNVITKSDSMSQSETVYCNMVAGEHYYLHYDSDGGDVLSEAISKVYRIGQPSYEGPDGIDTTDELLQVGEEMAVEDVKEIQLDEVKQVGITFFGAKSIYKFTPEEDGDYKFIASGNDYVLFSVLNEEFNYISSGKAPYIKKLEAGKTYIITSYISGAADSGLGEYEIKINKLPKAEKMEITNEGVIVGNIGDSLLLDIAYTPAECESFELEWSSSDESIVEVDEGRINLKKVGKATITVSGENGLTDSIEVEVVHHPEIKNGETKSLEVTEKEMILTFIPEVSGVYSFSAKIEDAEAFLSGEVAKIYSRPEVDFAGKGLLNLEHQFDAGEVYYITINAPVSYAIGELELSMNMQYLLYQAGDITKDGNINAEDALLALKAAAKIIELTAEESRLGDLNSDNLINAQDALEILKTAAKITE